MRRLLVFEVDGKIRGVEQARPGSALQDILLAV